MADDERQERLAELIRDILWFLNEERLAERVWTGDEEVSDRAHWIAEWARGISAPDDRQLVDIIKTTRGIADGLENVADAIEEWIREEPDHA